MNMFHNTKKVVLSLLIAFIITASGFLSLSTVKADSGASLWKLVSNNLTPVSNSMGIAIPSLNSSGTKCLHVNSTGVISATAGDCGSGGGGYTISTGLTDTGGTLTANISTGKAGGQTIYGSITASQDLTLSSTTHATKGHIVFGLSNYNEATNQLVLSGGGGLSLTGGSATFDIGTGQMWAGSSSYSDGLFSVDDNGEWWLGDAVGDVNNTYISGSDQSTGAIIISAPIAGTFLYGNLTLSNYGGAGTKCLQIDNDGLVAGATCATGTVTSVSGTSNRITSTGGTTPVIDISATFEALLGKVANPLSQFASTTSAQLAGVISNETGSGALVFGTSPTLTTPVLGVATGTSLALGGATIGSNALAVTGSSLFNNDISLTSGSLVVSGNISAPAWTTSGIRYKNATATLTDTTSSGTVATAYTNAWGGNTIAASSSTTFTNYFGSYFTDPTAGTNVTLTNKWAVGADSLKIGTSNPLTVSTSGVLTATSPVFTTPNLGTPSAATLTNATGLPISSGVSGLGTGVATFLGTPSSANLASAITDETGSGVAVFGTTPTFTTNITTPKIIGGTGTTSTLTLQTTSGVGTTNADMIFLVGNNGGTEALRIANSGAITTSFNVSGNSWLGSTLVRSGSTSGFQVNGRSRLFSSGDGLFELQNAAGTDFTRLNFGGTTSSFPAIKKNSTTLEARLADDSAFAATQSLYDRFGSGSPESAVTAPVGAVYHRTDGGAGTSFYVKESGSGNTGWVAK